MVFGIGEGRVEVMLDKDSYKPGEKIHGKVNLVLNKPKEARELRVRLIQEVKERRGDKSYTRKDIIGEVILGGKQEYSTSNYEFELTVPNIGGLKVDENSPVGMLKGALETFGVVPRRIYYVEVSLDLPLSFDISKKVHINIVGE
ncbi:MAG: hypothetical protein D6797_05755 [Bdellovibrio sp.]|nr:MAG: hypothetical protein D6797_05755 [Bdellovibrio sp.]